MTHTLDDLPDLDDDRNPAPPPLSRTEQARRATKHNRSTTREHLLELVDDALGAKLAHDVGRLAIALDHLDTIAANLDTLRATIAAEQTTRRRQDTHP